MLATINRTLERMTMALNPIYRSERAAASKQLEEFRNMDGRSMASEMARIFVADTALMQKAIKQFNIAGKACDDLAIQYRVPPKREFGEVSESQAERWAEVYDELEVDSALALGETQTVAQQCMIYGVWPDQRGKMRLTRFLTFQVESVSFDDPWAAAAGDLQDASQVVLVRPAYFPSDIYQAGPTTQFVARVVLERDWAYYEMPDGTKWGLLRPDMSNPLGFVPVEGTRRALPIDDVDWLPEVAQDIQSAHIGTSLGCSDIEHILRQDIPVTTYAAGLGAKLITKGAIKKLAGGLVPIPDQVTLVPLNTAPAIEKYISAIDHSLSFFAQFRNLRPEGYSGLTGAAKQVDMFALEQERLKQENRLRKLERGLVRLIARVHVLTQRSALTLEEPKLQIDYVYPRTRENVLQEAQALPLLMAMGLADAVDEIAANEKVGPKVAQERWEQRMLRWREMVAGGVLGAPGLDKIGGQLGDKNAPRLPFNREAGDAGDQARGVEDSA